MLATPLEADTARRIDGPVALNTRVRANNCTVNFDGYHWLEVLPQSAGNTFATSPFYIEGCGVGYGGTQAAGPWVHVRENDVARYGANWGSSFNHYHLLYENGVFCIPAGGSYGYMSGGGCVAVPDPATEPRYLAAHHGSQWIRIYVNESGVAERTFDFKKIQVKGAQGIKLYFRKANGNWLHWNNLGTGTWNVAPYAAGIREILISAAGGSTSSYSFDNVDVGVD